MALINTRLHSGTSSHAFAQRLINNFEASCNRVAKKVHFKSPSAPLPTICDAVAALIEDDSALLAEFISPDCNAVFIKDVAAAVASTFERDRAEYEPTEQDIAKALNDKRLAHAAYGLLALSDKLAIVRTLTRDDAITLCSKKIEARRKIVVESLADITFPMTPSAAERRASPSKSWREQSREDKSKRAVA